MRLVYTADLHGDIASYHALLDLAVVYDARAAIVGGDLLPHAIKLDRALSIQRAFIRQKLRPLLVEFRLAHPEIAIYLLAGNDDWSAAIADLADLEAEGLAWPLHERVYDLACSAPGVGGSPAAEHAGMVWLAGYSCVPPTPFSIKDYERCDAGPLPPFTCGTAYSSWEGEIRPVDAQQIAMLPGIADGLAALAQRSDPARTIYVCHTPPAGTPLDQMRGQKHVGSRALRSFIETYAPPLTLHGHIHEAPQMTGHYATQIGTTWCVNPGNDQRRFHAVMLDTCDIAGTMEHTVYGRPILIDSMA